MPVKTRPSGPVDASIMIIGEAPGAEEEVKGVPFVGASGNELTRMLAEAGIQRDACFLTNVCKYRPPNNEIEAFFLDSKLTHPNELVAEGLRELTEDIGRVKPKMIIALGNTPLWALTGKRGITKWRGSMLDFEHPASHHAGMLLPTLHPAAILREWSWRSVALHDLRRANAAFLNNGWPQRQTRYLIRPKFDDVMDILGTLIRRAQSELLPIASDIETRLGYVACHGIAWSNDDALCIPALCVEKATGYWTLEEELAIWQRERELLTHENVEVIGQNYIYDAQYFARRKGYIPRLRHDTLMMQHVAFPGHPKGLDYISSMYRRRHVYWKDEGKLWDPRTMPEDQLWGYNCEDACATFESRFVLEQVLHNTEQWENYLFKMRVWQYALEMNLRGVRIDQVLRGKIAAELLEAIEVRRSAIKYIVGHELNVRSSKQMFSFFYGDLKCQTILHRKTRRPTCDEEALEKFAEREPLLKGLVDLIIELRSLGVFLGNFIQAPLDSDGRMRSSFNPAGAETLRWSSTENAFGTGTNLQNIPKGEEEQSEEDLYRKRGIALEALRLPNVRKLFVPDPGYEIADIDLAGADAQVVAWEANDDKLKDIFRKRLKLHAVNARDIFGDRAGPDGRAQPYYDYAKIGVHLTNYAGSAKTCAAALGISEYEAAQFQKRWFQLHPNILDWHNRVEADLLERREVKNKFGYRRFYTDRVADLLPEALAWIPQSTVACITDRALVAIRSSARMRELGVEILLQVHDSLIFQYPIYRSDSVLREIQPLIHIIVPYPDPLVIPWGLKTSQVSWGHCEKRDWP